MSTNLTETEMTTLALYGWEDKFRAEDAAVLNEGVCEILGEAPEKMIIGYNRKRERIIKYETGKKRVQSGLADDYTFLSAARPFEEENIRDLCLDVTVTEGVRRKFSASWRKKKHPGFDVRKLVDFFCSFRRPLYGISYHMPFSWSPILYSGGIGKHGAPEEINQNSARFLRAWIHGEIAAGRLRDIYLFNVLSSAHLDAFVDGVRLQDWIVRGDRGHFSFIKEDIAVWQLEADQLTAVRAAIKRNGLLIS